MKNVVLVLSIAAVLSGGICTPVLAQFNQVNTKDLPKVNYYMARQQIQITDDAPAVNDMRTNPQPGSQNPAAASGAMSGRQPLQRAGFMSNMGAYHAGAPGGSLPQVNNGLPRSLPQTANGVPKELKAANAGKMRIKNPPTVQKQRQAGPPVVKTYKPYATTPVAQTGGGSGGMLNSSSSVKGSVLHWNRHH